MATIVDGGRNRCCGTGESSSAIGAKELVGSVCLADVVGGTIRNITHRQGTRGHS